MSNNELTRSTVSGISTDYRYDSDGNLISRTTGPNRWTYFWSLAGRLVSVSNNTGAQGFYAYDGFGRRVESKEAQSTVFYGYLGTETLADLGTGSENDYIYSAGLRVLRSAGSSSTTFFYHPDAIGSTRLITDPNKTVVFSDSYQPYGQDNGTPTGSDTYRFTGKPVSSTTGLYYEYQRWYDPSTGRFISQDPLGWNPWDSQSLNPYAYVGNQPTLLTDPTGAVYNCGSEEGCQVPGNALPGNEITPTTQTSHRRRRLRRQ